MNNPVPATRVMEWVNLMPGVRPRRLFGLMVPHWSVEIRATVREAQAYEVFDRYLSRGIDEGRLHTAGELVAFFGVDPGTVERSLRFLAAIGHLSRDGDRLALTALGRESLRDNQRYVVKEDHQRLYFDTFSGGPLPRSHYAGADWRPEPKVDSPYLKFDPIINPAAQFRPEVLRELQERPDREEYNLPRGLTGVELESVGTEYLPVIAVDADPAPLVFGNMIAGVDEHLTRVLAGPLAELFTAEPPIADELRLWRDYLDRHGLAGELERQPNGGLRVLLDNAVLGGQVPWHTLGNFRVHEHSILQLWSADPAQRRRAAVKRAEYVGNAKAAQQLEVEPLSPD